MSNIKKISKEMFQAFERSRDQCILFVDISKIKKNKELITTDKHVIYVTNEDNYFVVDSKEFIPYTILTNNPFRHNLFNYKVVDYDKEAVLPIMKFDDPVRIWKDYNHGDVIQIIRPDGDIYHRRVE